MKRFFASILFGALVILMGCNQGVSGDPGASSPPSMKPVARQTDAAKVKWTEYTNAMQKQWDQLSAKYAELEVTVHGVQSV